MGTFSMDMSSYEVERDAAIATDYGDEVLCAGWIPSLACHQPYTGETALASKSGKSGCRRLSAQDVRLSTLTLLKACCLAAWQVS